MQCCGCLKTISKGLYCPVCKKSLFNGRSVKPLSFNKEEFYKKQSEMAVVMSISGVQDKISLRFDEESDLVPTVKDGRYILKPIPARSLNNKEDIVANEHLCMQLSAQIFDIETAVNGIVYFNDGEPAYITRRFDYASNGTKLDQEDFASILNMTQESAGQNFKYDLSYQMVAQAIKKFIPAYRPALEEFYKRVLLNYLIGNSDAHLKNFSVYRKEGRRDLELTPNYDILYTSYHINETIGDTGLDLFKEDIETRSCGALGYYSLEDFEEFAGLLEIPEKRLKKIFKNIFERTGKVEDLVSRSYLSEKGKDAFLRKYHDRLYKRVGYAIGGSYAYSSKVLDTISPLLKRS